MILISFFKLQDSVWMQFAKNCICSLCTLAAKPIYLRQYEHWTSLGKCKDITHLLDNLTEKYGNEFIQYKFSALGINYSNKHALEEISCNNYLQKLEKAKSWVEFGAKEI